jgi:hypothetical protein
MARAARFQTFEVLDRGIEKLPVVVGHGVIVAIAPAKLNWGKWRKPRPGKKRKSLA